MIHDKGIKKKKTLYILELGHPRSDSHTEESFLKTKISERSCMSPIPIDPITLLVERLLLCGLLMEGWF